MSSTCNRLRAILAEDGPGALRNDQAAQDHLAECGECFAFLEAMNELEQALADLPALDVPDETVERLLAHPELAETPPSQSTRQHVEPRKTAGQEAEPWWLRLLQASRPVVRRYRLLPAAGATVLAVVIAAVLLPQFSVGPMAPASEHRSMRVVQDRTGEQLEKSRAELEDETSLSTVRMREQEQEPADAPEPLRAMEMKEELVITGEYPVAELEVPPPPPQPTAIPPGMALGFSGKSKEQKSNALVGQRSRVESGRRPGGPFDRHEPRSQPSLPQPQIPSAQEGKGDALTPRLSSDEEQKPASETDRFTAVEEQLASRLTTKDGRVDVYRQSAEQRHRTDWGVTGSEAEPEEAPIEEVPIDVSGIGRVATFGDDLAGGSAADIDGYQEDLRVANGAEIDTSAARRFLAERESLEDLVFQEPRGYWANTYVPGDRNLRELQARLSGWDRSTIGARGRHLHELARQVAQPFDPPQDAALAVFLHADRRWLPTRSRLLLQVGLKGTARHSGRRGAMNVGLVLDLRQPPTVETASAMRALVEAFLHARDLGDRFSLIVAGRPGGLVVPPGDFRYGPLSVALSELLAGEPEQQQQQPALTLPQAVAAAIETVSAADDPTSPLGSSVVVLVTASPLGADEAALQSQAAQSAVDGVPLSVVGIGAEVRLDQLDRLVLAGQGNRRLLPNPAEAAGLVDRELAAVGRVIARAVRLRIRLAPGVQLVDVLGSHRLEEARAQQVRDAEASIDQRLSRNLGITADRGLDEEGIQIVLPTFYADDAHVILLDLVAPGPGPVADVSVRYKDLVFLRNGVARDHLSLGRSEAAPGRLELNVLKNLLAHRLSSTLIQAGEVVVHDAGRVQELLEEQLGLLQALRYEVTGLEHDPDLDADTAMLQAYLTTLATSIDRPEDWQHLADSLRYAGRLKVVRALEADQDPSDQELR